MNIGKKLKSLRKTRELTQTELGKRLGIPTSTLGMYERNKRTPSPDVLAKYIDFFDVTYDYIFGNDTSTSNSKKYKTIDVLGSIPAGIPVEAISDIIDTEDLSIDNFDLNRDYIGLKVKGDSMYPEYLDGDTVIIQIQSDCESGQDAAVYVNGYNATLKKVIKNEDGTITLKPINQNYPPMTFDANDEEIKVLGIVKEIRRTKN